MVEAAAVAEVDAAEHDSLQMAVDDVSSFAQVVEYGLEPALAAAAAASLLFVEAVEVFCRLAGH